MEKLIRLVIGEEVQVQRVNQLNDIIQTIQEIDFPNLTVRRIYSGIDNESKLVYKYLEGEIFNALPVVFEIIISGSELPVVEKLKKEVDEGQINIFYS